MCFINVKMKNWKNKVVWSKVTKLPNGTFEQELSVSKALPPVPLTTVQLMNG